MITIKIYRLLGILTILLQNNKVTAPYLANKFEVSRRTINRDILDLCKAGLPIATSQGYDGGISIAEGYKIDKTIFTKQDVQDIFIALKGLNSVSVSSQYERLIEKIQPNSKIYSINENILIDLSSYYKATLAPKIELIKTAIAEKNLVSFTYYYSKGETKKVIEPYLIVFKWSAWYVFAYCTEKQAFRMFKLNRLWHLKKLNISFSERQINKQDTNFNKYFTKEIKLVAKFNSAVKYRLVEEYGINCFTITPDNCLLFERYFTSKSSLITWLLGFGSNVEVLQPLEIREQILAEAKKILKQYE
ncbi:YafY family protein [Clostridium sp. 'deep sea']|uniref:helix-turn-helix transcriptional regulator n=1 Tax=Clostridium sp. 'deep sea' TaxID=2779445 RepID=UPI00325FDF3B